MDSDRPHIDRRTVVGLLGTGTVVALAGCAGTDDEADDGGETDDDGDGDTTTDDDGDSDTTTDDEDTVSLDEPTEFPEGEECAVCNMIASDHPEWNAQLAHEDETRAYFCSSGCFLAHYVDPGRFDGPDAAIEAGWVTGYETGELLAAEEASFVRVTDSDHVDDIMMMNPTPFADRTDAERFVAEFDEYSDADIIGVDAFDVELAKLYRGRFFDDETQ